MARWLVLVAAIVGGGGCYSEPQPVCGFVCGEGGSCPGGYTCYPDNRCHLDGTSVQCDASPDTTAPTILMTTPSDGDDNVQLSASVVVLFSEPVVGLDEGFLLEGIEGPFPCSKNEQAEQSGWRVQYSPSIAFTGRAVLTASFTGSVMDTAGNPLAPIQWTFRTQADSVAPTIASTVPANGDTMVPTSVVIAVRFSEPINFTASSITVDQGVTGVVSAMTPRILTFTPDALAAATTYTVTVATDVTDFSGNPLAAPFVFSFTTM
jgi:Big-like domain-containing protein